MFLVPFNKKRISDSTLLSSQELEQQHRNQQQEQYRHCHHIGNKLLSNFYLGSTNLLNKIFIKSLASLKRCLHISLRTLLAILNSITSQCSELLINSVSSSGGGRVGGGNLNSSSYSLVCWRQPLPIRSGSPTSSPVVNSTTGYLRAITEASNWSEVAAAAAIGVAPSPGTGVQEHRNETIYFETNSEQPQRISITPSAAAAAETLLVSKGEELGDPYQCDTIEMDFCQRRIAQRAASNNNNNKSNPQYDVGSPANTIASSYYWDYPAAAAAAAGANSSTQTCTSVGPQVSGENKAAREFSRQLRRELVGPQFQGQQEHAQEEQQQRSYGIGSGLQMDMGNCRRECPQQQRQQQQQIILLQSKQQKLQRSLHEDVPEYPSDVRCFLPGPLSSSSSSSFDPSDNLMSAHHLKHYNPHNQQQRHKQQDGHIKRPMNFNSHSQDEQQQQQDATTTEVAGDHGLNKTSSMVLISRDTISNLTNQIALSMNKMKELEERVRVIPELQRRLDNVISDGNSSSVSDSNHQLTFISARNKSNHNNSSNYLNNHQSHNRQDLSFSTDNVAPYFSSGCNSNSFSVIQQRANNTNRATHSDELFRGIHPSLQRHYNSFRCSTNNNNNTTHNSRVARDASYFSSKDSVNASQTTHGLGNYSKRSPLTGSRDFSCNNGCADTASLTNNHHNNNNSSQQSLSASSINNNNMLRSNQNLNTNRSSSPKVEYEDLINDLLSLSYSVNYPSSATNSSQNQASLSSSSISKRPSTNQQVRENVLANTNNNKTSAGHDQQQQHQASGKRSSPSLSKLDCGCQSFKEHLRYNNSISREQRMQQHTRSQSVSYSHHNPNGGNIISATSLQSTPTHGTNKNGDTANSNASNNRQDASTNTDLSMDDIVTRVELNNLVSSMQKTYSTLSSIASRDADETTTPSQFRSATRKSSSSFASESTSGGSMSGHKSSSPHDIRSTDSCDDEPMRNTDNNEDDGLSESSNCVSFKSNKGSLDENDNHHAGRSQASDDDDGDDSNEKECDLEGNHSDACSLNGEVEDEDGDGGPYSLGSSYQDPSDFEEYCAYGESLDRRTKDFMSQSTKIPNDLRFALIRLNDFLKRNRSFEQIESTSGCIEVIRKEWFDVAANKDSQPVKTKLYVDYFESFTKQLLNTVVNLSDNAGNTAMHYAASLFKLDIIKVLLDTKVCDINCRNKAGYTPIMLLALADITMPEEQEVARQLFSMGDVNIKARTNGQTAIMLAASHGRTSTCKLLLECGADPSLQDFDGSTALMCGSEIGNEEIVKGLLAHKLTDPNAVDNDGLDALTIAMNNGHKNIGLILYAAKNVPRMVRSSGLSNSLYYGNNASSSGGGYLGASLRRSRAKVATNFVRRADSLLGPRSSRLTRHSQA